MNQNNEIYNIVLNKIKENGITLLKDNHPGTLNVAQKVQIKNTQLVLSYEYIRVEPKGFSRIERMSIGYINNMTNRYKSVANFRSEQQNELMKTVLGLLPPTPMKTPELDLIRALAENQYVQKQK